MRVYEIRLSHQAKKFIKKQNLRRKKQIYYILNSLGKDPLKLPHKKLTGTEPDYRIRVGSLRIMYSIYKNESIIYIIKIGRRENFYN